jgi:hypothetical protein
MKDYGATLPPLTDTLPGAAPGWHGTPSKLRLSEAEVCNIVAVHQNLPHLLMPLSQSALQRVSQSFVAAWPPPPSQSSLRTECSGQTRPSRELVLTQAPRKLVPPHLLTIDCPRD